MKIRIAQYEENEKVFKLLKDAALWLEKKGIDYWQNWHKPEKKYIEWILSGFAKDEFYFVEDNNEIVGMFRLQYQDELFWGTQKEKAGYIHSFTTDRTKVNKGIGNKVLKMIEEKLKSEGIYILRLDCGVNVKKLIEYYQLHGFIEIGRKKFNDEELALLEKIFA